MNAKANTVLVHLDKIRTDLAIHRICLALSKEKFIKRLIGIRSRQIAEILSLEIQVAELQEKFDLVAFELWLLKSDWDDKVQVTDIHRDNFKTMLNKIDLSKIDFDKILSFVNSRDQRLNQLKKERHTLRAEALLHHLGLPIYPAVSQPLERLVNTLRAIKETDLNNISQVEHSLNLIGWSSSFYIKKMKHSFYGLDNNQN